MSLARPASVLCALAVLAVGCGSIAERVTEEAVERAGGAENVDVDTETGEVRIETSEGTFQTGSQLPEDFPDQVPLPSTGTLVQSSRVDADDGAGWSMLWQHDSGAPADVLAQFVDELEDAGFAPVDEGTFSLGGDQGGMAGGALAGQGYGLTVGVVGEPDEFVLSLQVFEQQDDASS